MLTSNETVRGRGRPRRVRCFLCKELTDRPVEAHVTPALPTGENVPGARTKFVPVCPSCAALIGDEP